MPGLLNTPTAPQWDAWNGQHGTLGTHAGRSWTHLADRGRPACTFIVDRREPDVIARELLESMLTVDQLSEWREKKQFHVTSSRGNRFLIRSGRRMQSHNVFLVDEQDTLLIEFCGHARNPMPDADNLLAQKLLIETDEAEFIRNANQHPTVAGRAAGQERLTA